MRLAKFAEERFSNELKEILIRHYKGRWSVSIAEKLSDINDNEQLDQLEQAYQEWGKYVPTDLPDTQVPILEKYEPKESEIVGAVKEIIVSYINQSGVISRDVKDQLLNELGNNWCDTRVNVDDILKYAEWRSISNWQKGSSNLLEFWKQVAINSANQFPNPEEIADKCTIRMKEQFLLKDK